MKDFQDKYPLNRKMTLVYYVDSLSRVQGFDCGANNDHMLWCPEIGVSACIGYSLFHTFLEAKHKRIENLTAEIRKLRRQLAEAERAK